MHKINVNFLIFSEAARILTSHIMRVSFKSPDLSSYRLRRRSRYDSNRTVDLTQISDYVQSYYSQALKNVAKTTRNNTFLRRKPSEVSRNVEANNNYNSNHNHGNLHSLFGESFRSDSIMPQSPLIYENVGKRSIKLQSIDNNNLEQAIFGVALKFLLEI